VTEGALPGRPAGAHRRRPASRTGRSGRSGRAERPAGRPQQPVGRPEQPVGQAADTRPRRTPAAQSVRLAVSLSLAGAAYVTLRENERIRDFEAWLAGHVITIAAGLPSGNSVGAPVVWFPTKAREIGLVITPECTVALLMVPFIAASALLVWQRVPVIRPVLGLGVALVMLILVNQLRLLGIVWFVKGMGFSSGFYWGHTLVGSLITIIGLAGSLAVFAMLAVRRRHLPAR
jgi:exosortase/archaeosortase family protein